jgi:hypothetical protein
MLAKVKVKLSLSTTSRHTKGAEVQLHSFFNSAQLLYARKERL